MIAPGKEECHYILVMIESSLIDFSYTQPWADELIAAIEKPPVWLCELSATQYRGDQARIVREFVFSEPFESGPPELEKFHLACLWLRYERRELSWATFLQLAGQRLDQSNGDWYCETPYHYLNLYEDAYFSEEAEQVTKRGLLADQDLQPWIQLARDKFKPFEQIRKAIKAVPTR